MEICRLEPAANFSEAVIHGDLVHLSGQVAVDRQGAPFAEQLDEVLSRIDRLLQLAGSDRGRLLSATVHLADAADVTALNAGWSRWLDGVGKPARTTVQAPLVHPGFRVEITVVAARSEEVSP